MGRIGLSRGLRLAGATLCAAALMTTLAAGPAVGAPAVIPGQEPAGPTPRVEPNVREYPLTPISTQPEGVVYDARSRSFYASSSNGGSITKVTYPQGVATTFLPPLTDGAGRPDGRTEADGLAIDGRNRIYVAGGGSGNLYVYDLTTRRSVATFRTGLGGFTNDIAISPRNGDVYVTDSFRPIIFRVTAAQVAAGGGTPEAIPIAPEVSVAPVGTNPPKPFNANGIRFTPDGRFIVFDDLNDAALYGMIPPPPRRPAERRIVRIPVTGGSLGDADGLEFNGRFLYVVDNGGERILKLGLAPDLRSAVILSATTSPLFHTPTAAALAPGNQLLVPQSQLFEPVGPPFTVTSMPRP